MNCAKGPGRLGVGRHLCFANGELRPREVSSHSLLGRPFRRGVHLPPDVGLALQITMKMVPKMLAPLVKEWAPEAFVISFKLETDPAILIEKSRRALEKYRHQAVVANLLESRRTSVTVVTRDTETPLSLSEDEIARGLEIEEKIVSYLESRHADFMQKGSST